MTQQGMERRLAAIMVADVVGYSRMMGADEAGTLLQLQEHRFALIDPTIGQHRGRIVKEMGDGLLVEFQSVHEAVNCAAAIQRGLVKRNADRDEDRRIRLRIGINLGDILVEKGDIFGDGVNLAARLQTLAEPDGVCISNRAFALIDGETDIEFTDIGVHELKNIAKPVRAYHYAVDPVARSPAAAFRPFVDIPDQDAPVITGGCLCGSIRYEVTGKALGSMLCHCRMCQKFTGAPVLGGTTFLTEDLHFTKGSPKYYQSSDIAKRGFCGDCGTSLVYAGLIGTWTKWILVCTASLDDPQNFSPTYHLGVESAMPWMKFHDDFPKTMCKDSPSLIKAYGSVGQEVP